MKFNLYTSNTRKGGKTKLVKSFFDFLDAKMSFLNVVKKFKSQEHNGKIIEDNNHRFTYEFTDGEVIDLFFLEVEQ